jgi:hypothetical protein
MMILAYISVFVTIFGGGYLTLLGFKVINPQKKNAEHQEKMIIWHKKFGAFTKYGGIALVIWGILNIVYPELNAFNFETKIANKTWTQTQKDEMKQSLIKSSAYLMSINPDTADLVSSCFVEKYTKLFTIKDYLDHDKLPQEKYIEITMPIIKECFEQYGLKTLK